MFLWVGTGVGLGIVIDGELYRGAGGAAGEIAYMPVGTGDPDDPAYRRRGSSRRVGVGGRERDGSRASTACGRRSPKSVFAAAAPGDPAAPHVVAARRTGSRWRSPRSRRCSIRSS